MAPIPSRQSRTTTWFAQDALILAWAKCATSIRSVRHIRTCWKASSRTATPRFSSVQQSRDWEFPHESEHDDGIVTMLSVITTNPHRKTAGHWCPGCCIILLFCSLRSRRRRGDQQVDTLHGVLDVGDTDRLHPLPRAVEKRESARPARLCPPFSAHHAPIGRPLSKVGCFGHLGSHHAGVRRIGNDPRLGPAHEQCNGQAAIL